MDIRDLIDAMAESRSMDELMRNYGALVKHYYLAPDVLREVNLLRNYVARRLYRDDMGKWPAPARLLRPVYPDPESGMLFNVHALAKKYGVNYGTVRARLRRGLDIREALGL